MFADPTSELDVAALDHAKTLGETSDTRAACVKEILSWLKANPSINAHKDVKMILYFLRSSKFNTELTKKKIKSHYRMRAERVEWFEKRDPSLPEILELLDLGVFLPLMNKDSDNRQVVIIRTAIHNPKLHKQNDVLKVSKMVLDFLIDKNEEISIYGIRAIFDMKGVGLGHALQMTPTIIKRSVESWENYPCRPQKLEFVNAPIYVNVILDIFKACMSSKMKKRVFVKRGCPITAMDEEIFPPELNGKGENYESLTKHWKDVICNNSMWFKNDDKYKSLLPS